MRCVVLVIAHRNPAYASFKDAWVAHWDGAPSRLCLYLYNDPEVAGPPTRLPATAGPLDLSFPYAETYPAPGLLLKTLGAVDLLDRLGIRYDYLLRTNLSSLFDWEALDAHLDRAAPERHLAGVQYQPGHPSGACMLLSRDLVAEIVAHRAELDFTQPDDVAINRSIRARHPTIDCVPLPTQVIAGQDPAVLFASLVAAPAAPADTRTVQYRFHRGWGLSDDRTADQACMQAVRRALWWRRHAR